MEPRESQIESVFFAALEKTSPEERAAYLADACAGDELFRRRVERLLSAQPKVGNFLQADSPAVAATIAQPAVVATPGTVIGPYKLLQQIGEGGMGTVFMAEQSRPVQRKVALKLIKPGLDNRQVIARFEAERQALALMDHPNIAKVLDAGTTELGQPYFVMELVHGVPITKYCDEHRLSPRQRLELFVPVCHAIQHAHQKGIIHRDIKPSNVLIAQYDGKPVPNVIDFGVAKATGSKLTESTLFTEFGSIVGTLEYMSPEQADRNQIDIDTRSDIYSLGVLLYELLTGSTPLDKQHLRGAAVLELLRIIKEDEPPKPSTRLCTTEELPSIAANRSLEPKKLSGLMRGELDWIVMKALDKDRERRYETANGFAMDVQRYLNDEPVSACPPSVGYRLRKFVGRNKGPVLAGTLVLLSLLVGISGTSLGLFEARRQRDAAVEAKGQAIQAQQREAERAEGEKQAKLKAQAAAEAEKHAKLTAEEREAETDAVLTFVQSRILAAARPEGFKDGLGYDVTLREALEAALKYVNESFADQPLIEAKLRMTLGRTFDYLGVGKVAEEQCEVARALYTKHRGPDHRDTLDSMSSLAHSYILLNRHEDALKLTELTLERRIATLGPDHPATLASMGSLASCYHHFSRHPEALELREKGLKLTKEKFGPHHTETLVSMGNLADTYFSLGRRAEALQLREETLALKKDKLGPEHPSTLIAMSDLAESYSAAGRRDEAVKLHEQVLALRNAKLGPEHVATLSSIKKVASSYSALGVSLNAEKKFDEAITAHRMAIELNPNDAKHQYNLGASLRDQKKFDEAAVALRRATELNPKDGKAHHLLGHVLYDQSKFDAAATAYRTAAECDPKDAWAYYYLGRTFQTQKKLDEAMVALRQAIDIDPNQTWARMRLGNALRDLQQHDAAVESYAAALDINRSLVGLKHVDTHHSMNFLAAGYVNVDKHAEAIQLYEELLTLRTSQFGEKHSDTLATTNEIAWLLATCPDTALRNSARAVILAENVVAVDPKKKAFQNTLGVAYYRAGKWQAAIAALEQSMDLRQGNDGYDWFFLAMSHWQLGDKDEARMWFDIAVAWMDKQPSPNEELRRFRTEADELLGVKAKPE